MRYLTGAPEDSESVRLIVRPAGKVAPVVDPRTGRGWRPRIVEELLEGDRSGSS